MASKKNKLQKSASFQAPAGKTKKASDASSTSISDSSARSSKAGYTAPKAKATSTRADAQSAGSKLSGSKQWGIVGAVAVVVIGGLLFFSFREAISGGGSGVTEAAAWDLPAYYDSDPDGRVRLADFEGTPTVVNFWASWCTTCDDELPDFTALADRLEGKVDFVFMHTSEFERGDEMADRHDLENYNVGDDIKGTSRNGLWRDLGGGNGLPGTAFYNRDGELANFSQSAFNLNTLSQALVSNGLITAEELAEA